MEYTKEFLEKVADVGTLGYPLHKAINVLDIEDEKAFTKDFENPKSVVAKSFKKGLDKADFLIDTKLFEMAKNGDLNAINKYVERKRENIYNEKSRTKRKPIAS